MRDFCERRPVHVEAQVQQPEAGRENVFMRVGIFGPGAVEPLQPGLAGEPLDQTDDEALQGAMFFPRITEMDGRGGLFVEVAGGVEGFKHQIICVLLRMISEVLNICDRVMKGKWLKMLICALGEIIETK